MSDPAFTKTLILAGPTASGKTNLALKLAEKLPADLISADSRQVYRGLDIIPGKDVPEDFKKQNSSLVFQDQSLPVYTNGETRIFGYDVVKPDTDWSVSLFNRFCALVIPHLWQQNRLPLVVGGTGFYLQSLYHPIDTLHIPPNSSLRQTLSSLSVEKLQKKLQKLDPQHLDSLNRSDKNNPRRLIRAIEVARYRQQNPSPSSQQFLLPQDQTLKLLLTAPQHLLNQRIKHRVKKRFLKNWSSELEYLKSLSLDWSQPSATSLGYRQLSKLQNKELTKKQALKIWARKEQQYAKSQINWFANQSGFKKVSINQKSYPQKVVDLVIHWYSEN